ncbi:MAG: hypothetical protein ABI425_05425, partial [Patescibacteria group bacterium]
AFTTGLKSPAFSAQAYRLFALPKPISIRELHCNFRSISQKLESDEILLVKNRQKPEMILMSIDRYETVQKKLRELEVQNTLKAFTEYKRLKARDKLIKLKSLEDLIYDKN